DRFEPDSPGMHTTDTVDYGVVLDGEIWLELDNQQETKVERHQVVVQQGTRHVWRNKSDRCTTMMFVLIGATRQQPQR
ncbi:cupin domain-containing protein, partial [Massilia norwichensis]